MFFVIVGQSQASCFLSVSSLWVHPSLFLEIVLLLNLRLNQGVIHKSSLHQCLLLAGMAPYWMLHVSLESLDFYLFDLVKHLCAL